MYNPFGRRSREHSTSADKAAEEGGTRLDAKALEKYLNDKSFREFVDRLPDDDKEAIAGATREGSEMSPEQLQQYIEQYNNVNEVKKGLSNYFKKEIPREVGLKSGDVEGIIVDEIDAYVREGNHEAIAEMQHAIEQYQAVTKQIASLESECKKLGGAEKAQSKARDLEAAKKGSSRLKRWGFRSRTSNEDAAIERYGDNAKNIKKVLEQQLEKVEKIENAEALRDAALAQLAELNEVVFASLGVTERVGSMANIAIREGLRDALDDSAEPKTLEDKEKVIRQYQAMRGNKIVSEALTVDDEVLRALDKEIIDQTKVLFETSVEDALQKNNAVDVLRSSLKPYLAKRVIGTEKDAREFLVETLTSMREVTWRVSEKMVIDCALRSLESGATAA
ncbi:MAG: hypothetical protein WC052_03325 [Patescibacteria group bacterium]|jgi:DNA-binding phage protein